MTLTLFGPAWTATLVVLLLVGVTTHFLLRGRDLPARRRGLAVLAVVDMLASTSFHLAYLADPDVYFPLWQNLPLHLCTIVSFMVLPAVLRDAPVLRAICFFPGALAGFLTFFSAQPMYYEHELFDPKLGFFVAHGLNFVIPALMATLGIYTPTARAAVRSVLYVVSLGLLVLPVTLLIRAVADPGANYMYVFGGNGAEILDLAYGFFPVPVLYLLPLLAVITPVLLGQWGLYRAWAWVSARLRRSTSAPVVAQEPVIA